MKRNPCQRKQKDCTMDYCVNNNINPIVVRHQANARERYRTHSVNSAFVSLRQLIPTEPKTRKLSKIETLRLARSYIEHLFAILLTGMKQEGKENHPCSYVTHLDVNKSFGQSKAICTFCVATKD